MDPNDAAEMGRPGELPKTYSPADIEEKWYSFWMAGHYFHADPADQRPPYCIVIPPPNVTGALHVGHGLVNTLQDVLIRWARMQGKATLWVPGTDHAGIATQHVVAENLRSQGIDPREIGREAFLEHTWKWKEQYGGRIIGQLKRLGCSCDWDREAFTLDEARQRAVRVAFKRLYDKGLIYRGNYLVNWDPVDRTALSDDEVDYEDEEGHLWHLRYPYEDGSGYAVVATTRPETMLGDTAVAVNPTDERYKHLTGKNVILPLVDRPIPIIADDFVKKDFGTGMVKVTPAHDPNDFNMGLRNNLPQINILTEDAKINENGGKYCGLDRYEARERIVADLKALGLLEKIEKHQHRIGRGYRSKSVVEPRLSLQWFVKIEPLAEMARKVVREGRVRVIPKSWENTYFAWMDNVRDWCISRQLWWGHRIPIWYKKDDPDTLICHDGLGLPPEVEANPGAWRQDTDVLDTWFSSSLWPLSTLGWPDDAAELRKFYPTSVLVTGHDILFFWVARMIMMGVECIDDVPFDDVFLHGLIFGKTYYEKRGGDLEPIRDPARKRELDHLDALPKGIEFKWEKMSKSKGNVIDPLEMIAEYGADAFRLTLTAYAAQGRNIDLDPKRFEGYRNFVNKLWNAARFVLMTTEELDPLTAARGVKLEELEVEDRWILSLLTRVRHGSQESLGNYEFDQYVYNLYHFTWHQYCDWYLEAVKHRLYAKEGDFIQGVSDPLRSRRSARIVVTHVLETLLRLFQPVIPFVAEEIWQTIRTRLAPKSDQITLMEVAGEKRLRLHLSSPSLTVAPWPIEKDEATDSWIDVDAEEQIAFLQNLVTAIRNLRAETGIAPSTKIDVFLSTADERKREWLHSSVRLLRATVNLDAVGVSAVAGEHPSASVALVDDTTIHVVLPPELIAQEKLRLQKELERLDKEIATREKKLSNANYVEKAPKDVVDAERGRLDQAREKVDALRKKLASLG